MDDTFKGAKGAKDAEDHLITRPSRSRKLAEEEDEPIDAAPVDVKRSPKKVVEKRPYYSGPQRRKIKRSKGRRRDEEGETTSETPSDVTQSPPPPTAPTTRALPTGPSATSVVPKRPAWMPEDVYKRQVASIETSAKPTSDTAAKLKVEHTVSKDPRARAMEQEKLQTEQKGELVKNFYNDQTFRSRRKKRTESKIYKLRSFNNCIKYILILKYATRDGNVLDLGCGKGGDLQKWDMAQTSSYVGIDLSDQSIKEAIHRYRRSRCHFKAVFATGDAFKTTVPEILAPFKTEVNLEFDTVSMQFCLHYAFVNEESARRVLENVSRSLKVGGMFVGTIPSSDFIGWKIRRLAPGATGWGNSIYSVDFPNPPPKDGKFPNAFGNLYTYYLVDAVDHVPEYVVPFEKLRSLCEDYGLELRYKKNLFELFNKEIPNYFRRLPPPIIESLKRDDGTYGVSGEDRDACQFYLAFAFEKTG